MNSISINVDTLASIPQALFRLTERARAARAFTLAAERVIAENPAIFTWCESRSVEPSFSFDDSQIKLFFTGDGTMLGELWQILRQAGYQTDSRPKKGDTSYYGWWNKGGSPTIVLSFSSSLCRRVQVGTETKTVTVPIFETVCGDQIALPDEPTAASVVGLDSDKPALSADDSTPF